MGKIFIFYAISAYKPKNFPGLASMGKTKESIRKGNVIVWEREKLGLAKYVFTEIETGQLCSGNRGSQVIKCALNAIITV